MSNPVLDQKGLIGDNKMQLEQLMIEEESSIQLCSLGSFVSINFQKM